MHKTFSGRLLSLVFLLSTALLLADSAVAGKPLKPVKSVKRCGESQACDHCTISYIGRCTREGLQGPAEVLVLYPDGKARKVYSRFSNDQAQGIYLSIYPHSLYARATDEKEDYVTFNLLVPLENGSQLEFYGWPRSSSDHSDLNPEAWYEKPAGGKLDRTPLTTKEVLARIEASTYKQPSLKLPVLGGLLDGSHDLTATTTEGPGETLPPGTTSKPGAPMPDRVAPEKSAAPAVPVAAGGATTGERRVRSYNRTLVIPKGYDAVEDARLYTVNTNALGAPLWIVAQSREEAAQVGQKLYSFWSSFNNCLSAVYCWGEDGKPDPGFKILQLDFGWIAIVQAFRAGTDSTEKKASVFYAASAPSRQTAIDDVLADYRQRRDGTIIQSLRVGLVSRIDWARVEKKQREEEANKKGGGYLVFDASELNYKTSCDWASRGTTAKKWGNNEDPDVPRGKLEQDPACVSEYRPDEKLPPPVFKVLP